MPSAIFDHCKTIWNSILFVMHLATIISLDKN